MQKFEERKFNLVNLQGISTKNIEEHLKLYAGYIKNANFIQEKVVELMADTDNNAYILGELERRFSFEFNGMRNHEYYFASLEGGPSTLASDSKLKQKIEAQFGTFDAWLNGYKRLAMTRGVGWAMLYYDKHTDQLLHAWVDEQHLGQLNGCQVILALDMWEHAYVYDYPTSEKKKYIEAFFNNLNRNSIEENYKLVTS
ncbi:MAG: superoxide dismutase [Candidatus Paceibacterota bacterium]